MDILTFLFPLRSRWTKSEGGSAAIEFAFVAPIFFALMLGIMEVGVMTFAQFAMQNAVIDTARLIRTGQAQNIDLTTAPKCLGGTDPGNYASQQAWFKGQICCHVDGLISDCTNQVHVNVSSVSSSSFNTNAFSQSFSNVTDAYNPGAACNVVLIRATYAWRVWFPGLKQLLDQQSAQDYLVNMNASEAANSHLLSATAAFRNEPFGATTC